MRLRHLIIASAFVAASGIPIPVTAQENFSPNTDRPGNDFRNIPLKGNANDCLKLCNRESECRAWTFVKAGIQGPSARCFLKNPIPAAVPNQCCTSGVIRRNL
jgi:PAN domain